MSNTGDPVVFKLDRSVTGLELATRWMAMTWPGGFPNRLRVRPTEVREGFIRIECEIDPGHSNFIGLVHGGVSAALVDIAGGGAAMTLLRIGESLLTIDLNLRYLNAAPATTTRLIAEGTAVHHAPRKVVANVTITADDGTVTAMGSTAIAIRPAA